LVRRQRLTPPPGRVLRTRLGVGAAALLLALGIVALLLALEGPERERQAPRDSIAARPASEFLDSVGVVTHFNYVDTAYANRDVLLSRLKELRVRHVRDAVPGPGAPNLAAGLQGAAARGIGINVAVAYAGEDLPAALASGKRQLQSSIVSVEGPNEPDSRGGDAWVAPLRSYLPQLRTVSAQILGRSTPVIGPSFIDSASRDHIAGLATAYDASNIHPYPGGQPPETNVVDEVQKARSTEPSLPVIATETGYHDALSATSGQPPVPEDVAGTYVPRLALEYFRVGVRRTFLYELADEKPDPEGKSPENRFGLVRNDLSPKPAFTALSRLLRAVGTSPGSAARGRRPDVGVHGGGTYIRHLLLERSDGSAVLALWRPVSLWDPANHTKRTPLPVTVRVEFSSVPHALVLSRPSGAPDVREAEPRRTLTLRLGADVTLVSFS
jgi:hypothetical protein